jgi:hypothetical protein
MPIPTAAPESPAPSAEIDHEAVRVGKRVGPLRVVAREAAALTLNVAGDLGVGRGLVGAVPIVWCAAAWAICLRERLVGERLTGCVILTIMAAISAFLMTTSMGVTWRFDGRRRRVGRRAGVFGKSISPRCAAGVRVETARASALADTRLRLVVTDSFGREQFEVAAWRRCDVDRAQVDGLAAAIRGIMGWDEVAS